MKSFIRSLFTFWLVIIFSAGTAAHGQSISVSGKLLDRETGRIISNGTITLNPGNRPVITNTAGEYFFTCTPGIKQISAGVLGYRSVTIDFRASSDTIINIYLEVLPFELNEVTVTGEQNKNVRITRRET